MVICETPKAKSDKRVNVKGETWTFKFSCWRLFRFEAGVRLTFHLHILHLTKYFPSLRNNQTKARSQQFVCAGRIFKSYPDRYAL